jgi:hypothetical protein
MYELHTNPQEGKLARKIFYYLLVKERDTEKG